MGAYVSVGDVVADRYRLERMLGSGGMATVYLAHDAKLNRNVAIKLLHTELARQPSFRMRFRQEAQAAARITHPGVVRVFDAGDSVKVGPDGAEEFWPFMVMEYLDGTLLSTVIADGPLDQAEALRVTTELLTALEHLHNAGIVHRDIKPSNIMILDDGTVKLMDFGVASAVTEVTETVSQTTSILGTASYFSPEQARGETVDERSDLYSTGVVLFELLTGSLPFREKSPVKVAYQHLSEPPAAPSSLNPAVSAAVDAVVANALTKSKATRYRSAGDFKQAIEQAGVGEVPEAPSQTGDDVILLNDLNILDLSADEIELRQISESATDVRNAKRPPVMWLWAGGTLIFGLVVAIMVWAFVYAPTAQIASTDRKIPDMVGLTEVDAKDQLTKLDLRSLVLQINDDTVEAGNVVRTDPAAGEVVVEGTRISIYVSKGKAEVGIPDVKNLSLEQAKAAVTAAGFVPGAETQVHSPTIAAGTVVGSDPTAGTAVAPGTTVNFNVSDGKVAVPDVVGKPLAEASAAMNASDVRLTVDVVGDSSCALRADKRVIEQSIRPGDVEQGSTIKLYFCSGS